MTTTVTRKQRTAATIGGAALVTLAMAPLGVALAQEEEYPPVIPTAAAGVCVGDVPYFQFQVDFGSDEFVGQPLTITFQNPGGEDFVITTTVPPRGQSATVLWPGAAPEPNPDWPGWELVDGVWVETDSDAGAFTRAIGGVTVTFEVNPTLTSSVTYPPASAICANPQNATPPPDSSTPPPDSSTPPPDSSTPPPDSSTPPPQGSTPPPETPSTGATILPFALVGGALLAAGTGAVVVARRRAQ